MKNIKKYVNEYISPIQYMILIIYLSKSFYSGIGFSNILLISKLDTWLSLLIGFIIGFIPIVLIIHITKKNINLFEVLNTKVIKFLIIIFIIFSFTVLLNDFINFASVKYLFETPKILIALILMVSNLYIVNKGIETIGRSALFMFYICVVLSIFVLLGLFNYIDINNIKPMFITKSTNIIKSSIHFISYSITPIIFLSIIPKNNLIKEEYNKYLLIGYIISFIIILVTFFLITTVFNYNYISLFNYPSYMLLKKIDFEFISNVENIFSLIFIVDYFYSLLIYIYIIKYYLNKELNVINKKLKNIHLIIIAILVYISLYVYKDINIVHLITNTLLYIIFIVFILLFIIISLFTNKKDS